MPATIENRVNGSDISHPFPSIKALKLENVNRLIIANLNINSIKENFESFKSFVSGNIDIVVVNECKTDTSFTQSQFSIAGYHLPFRKDRNLMGGGVMIFVREDIPCKEIRTVNDELNIEGIFYLLEITSRKQKWRIR